MSKFTSFVGPAFEARAAAADYERAINLYCEANGPNAPDPWTLYPTAGLAAFATLPTAPVRGTWVGENRLFAVAGAVFYEVFNTTPPTYTNRGTVADDSAHSPVQIFPNGNQVMVISAGQVYIDTGTALIQPYYSSAQGTLNSDGSGNLTLAYGDYFDPSMVGQTLMVTVGGTDYPVTVSRYVDANNLVITGSLASGSNLAYKVANSGLVSTTTNATLTPSGTTLVQWISGDTFDFALTGHTIYLGLAAATVQAVIDSTHLVIGTASVGNNSSIGWYGSIPVTASCGAVLDGYFIVATPNTKQVNIGNLYNGLRWDPADYAIKEAYPDNIVQMIADHKELILFGSQTCEVWRNTGAADFPITPDPGMFVALNCGAPWSPAKLPDGPVWLEGEARGGPVCYYAQGFVPKRVSTHALEYRWKNYSTWTDAEGFSFEDDGHWFYQISFPTAGETWVYDATAGCWHQRSSSSGRHKARCHAYVWGKHIVGDYATGALYLQSSEYLDDAGTAIVRTRRAPHLSNDLTRTAYHDFLLALALPATFSSITLAWSDDYGTHWTTPKAPDGWRVARGQSGRPLAARWSRLGSAQDRIFEVSLTASTKTAILSAEINPSAGS